ncbi:DUF6968 family protein [Nocardia cyriacigeorgica]|uniref:DUF6968 domain-containing protein n=1 Tax=Nocardia cyriacigeorgica TaxID=135487 RepID=A0A4V6IBM4_9NOCA|nr:Uncharacterised protein [Nocardia cyriacigeorgica]
MQLREFIGPPIAERELTRNGERVLVECALPAQFDGGGGYGCSIRIDGIPEREKVYTIGGADSEHALIQALQFADRILSDAGCLWNGSSDLGIVPPRFGHDLLACLRTEDAGAQREQSTASERRQSEDDTGDGENDAMGRQR